MKTKFSTALTVVLVLLLAMSLLAACNTGEVNLEGKINVTFMFNGGVLSKPQEVSDSIIHAYEPNSYVIDITKYKDYKFANGHMIFEGWFADPEMTVPWDFTQKVTKDATLYAKWSSPYTFVVKLVKDPADASKDQQLGVYYVEPGTMFNAEGANTYGKNLRNLTPKRTFLGYYEDRNFETEWNLATVHEQREDGYEIPVYVKSIEGAWQFVSTYEELKAALKTSDGIWLENDINCNGERVDFSGYSNVFNRALRGDGYFNPNPDGYTISNFEISGQRDTSRPSYSIFDELGSSAQINNVHFTNVKAVLTNRPDAGGIDIAALAISAQNGAVVDGVTISGTFNSQLKETTDVYHFVPPTKEELQRLFTVLVRDYDANKVTVTNSQANLTPISQ